MASFRTHYQNLKIDRKAPEGVIKAAYKALTFEHHPDRNPGNANAEKTFKLIRESYEVLIDPVSRRKHDEWIARQEAKTKRNQRSTYTEGGREEKKRESKSKTKRTTPPISARSFLFNPYLLFLIVFAVGATYQMSEWSRTGAIDAFLDQYLERPNDPGSEEIVDTDDLSDSNANIDASVAIVSVETAPVEENVDSSLPPVSAESSDENIFEDVLLDFYEKANGDNWTNNDGWGVGDYCTWYGILCNGGEVTQIRLTGNNLNGIISKELDNLTRLTQLELSNNQLTGSIPEELGNLTSLHFLFLFNNELSGPIPTELGNLTSLFALYLYNNELSGPIPESFSNLKSLKNLLLNGNNLTGVVPGFLRNGDFERLNLEGNNFDAEFSEESLFKVVLLDFYEKANGDNWTNNDGWGDGDYCDWYGIACDGVEVTEIILVDNNLSGMISSRVGDLTSLKILRLRNNSLSGNIPDELGNLFNLWDLDLHNNSLSGSIPSQLGNLKNLAELSASDNDLFGPIPSELGKLVNLQSLGLYNNSLTGSIPSQLGNLANLTFLSVGGNLINGSIPLELGDLTKLNYLRLGPNALEGVIPQELARLNNLIIFDLYSNNLSGSVPVWLGDLSRLRNISLGGNQLSGQIPTEIGNLNLLEELYLWGNDLTGPIPESFTNLTSLKKINLRDNALTGFMPEFLNEMDLEMLELEGNNFDAVVSTSQELVDSLNTLNELHENGLLTDEELELAKRKILQ